MKEVNINRWIDMDGPDFQRLEDLFWVRKSIKVGIEIGIIKIDKAGYMWQDDKPIYAKLDGEFVGLRYSAKAVN